MFVVCVCVSCCRRRWGLEPGAAGEETRRRGNVCVLERRGPSRCHGDSPAGELRSGSGSLASSFFLFLLPPPALRPPTRTDDWPGNNCQLPLRIQVQALTVTGETVAACDRFGLLFLFPVVAPPSCLGHSGANGALRGRYITRHGEHGGAKLPRVPRQRDYTVCTTPLLFRRRGDRSRPQHPCPGDGEGPRGARQNLGRRVLGP